MPHAAYIICFIPLAYTRHNVRRSVFAPSLCWGPGFDSTQSIICTQGRRNSHLNAKLQILRSFPILKPTLGWFKDRKGKQCVMGTSQSQGPLGQRHALRFWEISRPVTNGLFFGRLISPQCLPTG
ncbi:hypothetical protein XELAEV_18040326mg [Xenopus laevis]|uniref:Uncharacterized protein n=1 Tax=Xenopus laevis TaxID=8355 RepID=A0A974H8U7_XENLA|nr:hypothetical protein XELAEV_18040326mg [Xenopus laevis]